MTDVAPGCESPEARGRRLYIAESVAAERIDFLFGKVVESFQKSTGPVTSNNAGTTRLALAAARLATMGGKLPANALLPELPDDLPVEDLPAEEFCDDNPVHCPDHPVEGCSRTSPEEAVSTTAAANAADVTVAAATASAKSAELAAMLRFLDSRPVQAAGENETWNSFVRQEMMHSPFLQAVLAEG